MIFLLHGDNLPRSRETIIQLQQKLSTQNKKEVSIGDISAHELKELCASFDIFSEPPFIVLDISDAGNKNVTDYVNVLKTIPTQTNLVLLADRELSKANAFLKASSELKSKVVFSKSAPTSNVFKFIDAVYTKNRKLAYSELRDLLVSYEDPFYLFSMLLYGLRNIAYAKFNSPALDKMAPFVKSKAIAQAHKFTHTQIHNLYTDFYNIDKNLKTGKLSQELVVAYTIEKILQ